MKLPSSIGQKKTKAIEQFLQRHSLGKIDVLFSQVNINVIFGPKKISKTNPYDYYMIMLGEINLYIK